MINKVILLGIVGKKEFKTTKNGSLICSLSVVTKRRYTDTKKSKHEITTWHNVNMFNKLASSANLFVEISDLIFIQGEISNKKIEENGINRIIHSITASEFKVIPKKIDHDEFLPNGNIDIYNLKENDYEY